MSSSVASELSRRLAQDAEAVCRYYLSNGRRPGRYWIVGDARNTPGRSLFVRLYRTRFSGHKTLLMRPRVDWPGSMPLLRRAG